MPKHRIKKYSRRMSSGYKKSRAPIVWAVIAFLCLSVTVSVLVGISLGKRAEAASRTPSFDLGYESYYSNGKKVTAVEAYHFPNTSRPHDYVAQKIYDLSVCIRHKDGSLDYLFEASALANFDTVSGERSFSALCADAHDAGAKICAYMYIDLFNIADEYHREVAKAYYIALIHEAAASGAGDILLLGLEPNDENICELEEFLFRASSAAEKTPLGVAADEKAFEIGNDGISLAARMRTVCDYIALDLTSLTVEDGDGAEDADGELLPSRLHNIIEKNRFNIKTYPARLLFSREHSKLYIPAQELGIENLQIVAE